MRKLILASASPRRKELLERLGLQFEVIASDLDEVFTPHLDPVKQVRTLAIQKALSLHPEHSKDIVIGADTIVVLEGKVLGKPSSKEEAKDMLCRLSGRQHRVITAFAVVQGDWQVIEAEETKVLFRQLDQEEIDNYVATGEPYDKAGGYGIQGLGCLLVERIEGCYFNVVGLPLNRLNQVLKQFGYRII